MDGLGVAAVAIGMTTGSGHLPAWRRGNVGSQAEGGRTRSVADDGAACDMC
jgi:hypothetical protein